MATRSGSVDPGALIYLMREHGIDAAALDDALNHESGLKALAGGSGSMSELEPRAREKGKERERRDSNPRPPA
jgi:acetate kinase